jgi:hypothetical protein
MLGKHEVAKNLFVVHFGIGKSFYLYSKVTFLKR